jgi:2-isopropylmalate synthase
MKAAELGFKFKSDSEELKAITARVKELEGAGYEFEAADASMSLLIHGTLGKKFTPHFNVETYHVSMRRDQRESICEATVRVRVGEGIAHTVAEGDGPVNALDGALRRALVNFFPKLKSVELTDYKVRIINGTTGTAAKTRVLITSGDGKHEWGTVGVSENIIEASLQALVDSMEFALLKK